MISYVKLNRVKYSKRFSISLFIIVMRHFINKKLASAYITVFSLSVLLVFVNLLFAACDNSDEGQVYEVQNVDANIIQFFNSEWPSDIGAKGAFFGNISGSFCEIINDRNEMLSEYNGYLSFPEIDFSKYSLILGQVEVPSTGYSLEKTEFYINDNLLVKVYIKEKDGGYQVISYLRFWGLFPKIKASLAEIIKIIKYK